MTCTQKLVVRWVVVGNACVAAVVLTVYALICIGSLVLPPGAPEAPYCDPGTYQTRTSDGGPQCVPFPAGVRP